MSVLNAVFHGNARRMTRAPLLAAGAGLLVFGTAAAQIPQAGTSMVLRPGDLVRVSVWRKPELSGDFLVAADSTLKHPLYRDVRVAGLTVSAARARIVDYLKTLENAPQISIEPLFRVSVGGEVRSPNLYALSPETSIAQAVALAGGPSERGRLDQVRLFRAGQETMIDLTKASADALDAPVASGDQIIVSRRSAVFRELVLPSLGALSFFASIANLFVRR